MVPRKPKLIAAVGVLALGAGLAWPWHREEATPATALPIAAPTGSFGATPFGATPPPSQPAPVESASPVTATTMELAAAPSVGGLVSTAISDHAAAMASPITLGAPPHNEVTPTGVAPTGSPQRTHVVHEGDSLERLAERYLGDPGRSIELFDLNREILENPHLLTIGTELKIPDAGDASGAAATP